jgi:hypothetical protein
MRRRFCPHGKSSVSAIAGSELLCRRGIGKIFRTTKAFAP